MAEPAGAGWAPVLYGRTRYADSWWRVVPEGADHRGWLDEVVRATVADGAGLRDRPRFVLARSGGHRLVGVACQAADLSASMHSDGAREMYCFVGWAASGGPAGPPPGPTWPRLRDGYRQWAGAVYERWMGPVWTSPMSQLRQPRRSGPEQAPWPVSPPAAHPPGGPALAGGVGGPQVVPLSAWERVWDEANAATRPMTVVLGWATMPKAGRDGVTHLGVADAPAQAGLSETVPPGSVPQRRSVSQARPPGPGTASRPGTAVRPRWLMPAIAGGGGLLGMAAVAVLALGLVMGGGERDDPGPDSSLGNSPRTSVPVPAPPKTTSVAVPKTNWLRLTPGPAAVAEEGDAKYKDGRLLAASSSAVLRTIPKEQATEAGCRARVEKRLPGLVQALHEGATYCLKSADRLALLVIDAVEEQTLTVSVTTWPA
ncbi:hypothetical protein [Actinomadura macra]|uniref:hypothetical protein n=1 Tax=Actinomadura macra TaxID=46164 RepID=UPI000835C3D7|nr:hypothetical protein [Actinomadura macra]